MKKQLFAFTVLALLSLSIKAQKIYDFAGNNALSSGYSGDGGLAVGARLLTPEGITFDAAGNMYIADASNHVVRKVNTAGIISTIAGNGTAGYTGDGSLATAAQLGSSIPALCFDGAGNLYIADASNNVVRMVNTAGIISTFAGGGGMGPASGNPATSVNFIGNITGLAFTTSHVIMPFNNEFGANGALFITTTSGIVSYLLYVKISTGILYMDGNSPTANNTGDGGTVGSTGFNNPKGMAFDAAGNLYWADSGNNRIRKISYDSTSTTGGIVSNFAGNASGTGGFSGDGGQATSAKLTSPYAVCFDPTGNMYIADYGNQRVRRVNTAGIITTIAGNGTIMYNGDAIMATAAGLANPLGVACDALGNVYVADGNSNEVREITTTCIPPTIFSQPTLTTSTVICSGSYVEFCVGSANATGFQWQVNKGSGFVNQGSTGYYITGCDTINGAWKNMNGWQYHCIVKCCSNVTSNSYTLNITYPSIAINTPVICPGNTGATFTVTSSTAVSYTWNTTDTGYIFRPTPTPSVTTSYTVTGIDNNGCANNAVATIDVLQPQVPAICEVTTDSVTNYKYNYIYWNASAYTKVDSFIVYRYDAGSGNYLRIGARGKDSLSVFIDKDSVVGGPHGGNPAYSAWKYKLAIKDSCGNIGKMGSYHQTMFVQQTGQNFSWTAYVDSGMTSLPTGYSFLRDDNNTGNYNILTNTSSTAATDPNYTSFPNAVYRVDALGFSCNPTIIARLSGNNSTMAAKIKSHSNTNNNRAATTGIDKMVNTNQVRVYPNPAANILTIGLPATTKATVRITSLLGSEVLNQTYNTINTSLMLDISKFESGTYLIQVTTDNVSEIKKIVKQ